MLWLLVSITYLWQPKKLMPVDQKPHSSDLISKPSPTTKRGTATYQKVINAGIEYIAQQGFHQASTNKIAKAAGVTWGTLQHQFGDRARLLEAILETCFDRQMQQLGQATSTEQPLEKRIDAIIDTLWCNQQTDSSRSMQEILLGVQGEPELSARFSPTLQKLRKLHNQQWQVFFADINISEEEMEAIKQLVFATLRGLAFDVTVRSSDQSILAAKALLKKTMLKLFTEND
jgi:AcrR family transcriptional regulator